MVLPLPLHPEYLETLLEAHWAAQVPAAASRRIPQQPDFSHTNLLLEEGLLRGRRLPQGQQVALDLDRFALRLGQQSFELEGRSLDEALAWLSDLLGGDTLEALEHDLPDRPRDKPFRRTGGEPQLQQWFALANRLLQQVSDQHDGGEVRLWPHHFDIATLIALDTEGGEHARSVNVGLSPGDSAYGEPYWYVTPWPPPPGAGPRVRTPDSAGPGARRGR